MSEELNPSAPARLPEPTPFLKRVPVELCNVCLGSGWSPMDPEKLCPACLGFRVIPNLPWKKRLPSAERPMLKPGQVQRLRRLGMELPEYPKDGTPEWTAFVESQKGRTPAWVEARRAATAARVNPLVPKRPPKVESKVITSLADLPPEVGVTKKLPEPVLLKSSSEPSVASRAMSEKAKPVKGKSPKKAKPATVSKPKPVAPPAGKKEPPKPTTTETPMRKAPRSRVIQGRENAEGEPLVNVNVSKSLLPKVMDPKVLGTTFTKFVRGSWENRSEHPKEIAPDRPLVYRGAHVSKAAAKEIYEYESKGGDFDALINARLLAKVG